MGCMLVGLRFQFCSKIDFGGEKCRGVDLETPQKLSPYRTRYLVACFLTQAELALSVIFENLLIRPTP